MSYQVKPELLVEIKELLIVALNNSGYRPTALDVKEAAELVGGIIEREVAAHQAAELAAQFKASPSAASIVTSGPSPLTIPTKVEPPDAT